MKNQSILKTKISLNKLFESIFDYFDVDDEIKKQDTYEFNYDVGKLQTMQEYFNSIEQGKLFAFNDSNSFPKLYAYKTIILNENKSWIVICNRDDKKWNVIGVELNKKRHFIHFNLGTFLTIEEAEEFSKTIDSEMDFGRKGYSCKWDP